MERIANAYLLEPEFDTTILDQRNKTAHICCMKISTQHLSCTKFNEVFKNKNLSLFTPKKDQCELWVRYSVGNLSTDAYRPFYYLHQERKNEARIEKN